jgi:hypothetical protein
MQAITKAGVVMTKAAPLMAGEDIGFGQAEQLLIRSWRRIAAGHRWCALMMDEFSAACGEDGPDVFAAFCTFLKALALAGRRQLVIGAPGNAAVTADERQVLSLLAAAQGGSAALLEAHLAWIAAPEKRHLVEIATRSLAYALILNRLEIALPAAQAPASVSPPRAVA